MKSIYFLIILFVLFDLYLYFCIHFPILLFLFILNIYFVILFLRYSCDSIPWSYDVIGLEIRKKKKERKQTHSVSFFWKVELFWTTLENLQGDQKSLRGFVIFFPFSTLWAASREIKGWDKKQLVWKQGYT